MLKFVKMDFPCIASGYSKSAQNDFINFGGNAIYGFHFRMELIFDFDDMKT